MKQIVIIEANIIKKKDRSLNNGWHKYMSVDIMNKETFKKSEYYGLINEFRSDELVVIGKRLIVDYVQYNHKSLINAVLKYYNKTRKQVFTRNRFRHNLVIRQIIQFLIVECIEMGKVDKITRAQIGFMTGKLSGQTVDYSCRIVRRDCYDQRYKNDLMKLLKHLKLEIEL